jgi:hypothetical protein
VTTALPEGALLADYGVRGDYVDCFTLDVSGSIALSDLMYAFYTSKLFRLERVVLKRLLGYPSTDDEARALAHGRRTRFAAWTVEARAARQTILAAGRTRSWFMVEPLVEPGDTAVPARTRLYFGSAVLRRRTGGLGVGFRASLGLHRLYSRWLLAAAGRGLAR